jgi:C6 transcription factor Pro1
MYHHQHDNDFADFGLSKRARAVLIAGLPSPDDDFKAMEEVAAFRFLGGTILWLDVISSITSGVTPRLLSYHRINLSVESPTRLEYIMGCKNLIMTQIGRIAALFEEGDHGYFDATELRIRADDIRHQVECALAHYKLETIGLSPPDLLPTMNRKLVPSIFVTRMFAILAFVYLHLVVSGFRDLELLNQYTSEVMDMVQGSASEDTLRAVVCPLYMAGIAAEHGDQPWFRKIFSTLPLLDPCLGHRQSILANLERVWNRRQKTPSLTWREFVNLSSDVMLI